MPLPTEMQVHVNVPLTNVAEAWYLAEDTYVAPQVAPVVPTTDITGLVVRYCRKDWFNTDSVRPRTPGTKSQGVGFHVDHSHTFYCRNYSHRYELPDEVRASATRPYQPERTGVQIITQRLKLKREELTANVLMPAVAPAAGWPWPTQAIAIPWNNANATPINDVDRARINMHLLTGFQPNTLVVNKQVFQFLRTCPQITAIYRNLGAAEPRLNVAQVAQALDIERLIVGEAVHDVGPMQGQWDGRWIWPNHALLLHVTPTPSLEVPSAAYIISYTGAGFTGTNVKIEQYRGEEDTKKDIYTGHIYFDVQIVESDLGLLMLNAVAGAGVLNQVVADIPICL